MNGCSETYMLPFEYEINLKALANPSFEQIKGNIFDENKNTMVQSPGRNKTTKK